LVRDGQLYQPAGQTFHGTPASYGVTIPAAAKNPEGAEAFVRFLLSDASLNKLERWGFLRSELVVVGDETAVPASLQSLIKRRRAP
jgi:hypothetical protein